MYQHLPRLENLLLSDNQLASFLDSLVNLTRLYKLGLENNQLISFPDEIKICQNYVSKKGKKLKLSETLATAQCITKKII